MNFCSELPVLPHCMLNSYCWVLTCVCNYFTDGCPWVYCGGRRWHVCHHWLVVGGLHTHCVESLVCCRLHHPSLLRGVEYEELGVPSCRVRVIVLPHPGHPKWSDLRMELLCFCAAEAVESAALMVLHTLSTHRPQEMLQTPLGLVPTLDPNDPLWLGRMANIATLLETVPPYDTI
jgi:hypothetical protein